MGIEFKVAAEAEIREAAEDEDVVEVPIDGKVYIARMPSVAQFALLQAELRKKGVDRFAAVFDFVESMMGEEAREHIERLVVKRQIEIDDLIGGSEKNPDGGLIDLILAEFTGRPTEPSTASSGSQKTGGRRSTGRSPGKGSTASSSPSGAS